jgi:flagellar biosynthesis protein FlhF
MSSRTLWKAHAAHSQTFSTPRLFRGKTLRDALKNAEKSLGNNLYIIGTYHVKNKWAGLLPGLSADECFEVEAVVDSAAQVGPSFHRHDLSSVHRSVSDVAQAGGDIHRLWDVPETLTAPFQYLLRSGVDEDYAERIVRHAVACHHYRDLADEEKAWQATLDATADALPVTGFAPMQPGEKRVILIIGPTGAGKTSATAKIASFLQIRHQVRLGLVSCDMFRIAAVEQLDTYARILDIPFAAADGAQSIADAVGTMDADCIIIDTPGFSPMDHERLQALAEISQVICPDETHLVLPLESAGGWARMVAEKFAVAGPDRLVVTKTDEMPAHGGLINLAAELRLPFSFVSVGQLVPDDLEPADSENMARMILG